jgi:hypothetical protein
MSSNVNATISTKLLPRYKAAAPQEAEPGEGSGDSQQGLANESAMA